MLTKFQMDRMVRDANAAEEMYSERPLVCDLACHVKALACDVEKLRDTLISCQKEYRADGMRYAADIMLEHGLIDREKHDRFLAFLNLGPSSQYKACEESLNFVNHVLEFFDWQFFPNLRGGVEELRGKLEKALRKEQP